MVCDMRVSVVFCLQRNFLLKRKVLRGDRAAHTERTCLVCLLFIVIPGIFVSNEVWNLEIELELRKIFSFLKQLAY